MSIDCLEPGRPTHPQVAMFAADDLAARRIESALGAAGMSVAVRARGLDESLVDFALDALVAVFGSGVTERDGQLRVLRRLLARTHLIAVMPADSRRGIRRAVESGADGVVFEADIETSLAPTVRAILAGQIAVPQSCRREVDRPTLSGREKQVLRLVVAGKSNKTIAAELFLAESTVKCHLSSAFSKLGVRSRNEAADLVVRSGSELGFQTVVTTGIYATTEGSEQMHTHRVLAGMGGEQA